MLNSVTSAFIYLRVVARFAKSQLDDRSFFGTHLKACYAPELETLQETEDKLTWRRLYYRKGLARSVGSGSAAGLELSYTCEGVMGVF